jgi:hypothetical protein
MSQNKNGKFVKILKEKMFDWFKRVGMRCKEGSNWSEERRNRSRNLCKVSTSIGSSEFLDFFIQKAETAKLKEFFFITTE